LLSPVDDLAAALADLHARGVRVAGAEAGAALTARESDLRGPLAIVVGSEGQGLGPAVRRRCDLLVRIPLHGAIDSLNAAVAGSILLFEAVAQRVERGGSPAPTPVETSESTDVAASESPGTPGLKPTRGARKPAAPRKAVRKPRVRKSTASPASAAGDDGAGATPGDDAGPGDEAAEAVTGDETPSGTEADGSGDLLPGAPDGRAQA
jgi:SpoU rRNA Methylase family